MSFGDPMNAGGFYLENGPSGPCYLNKVSLSATKLTPREELSTKIDRKAA
jgi:hypothetical protein